MIEERLHALIDAYNAAEDVYIAGISIGNLETTGKHATFSDSASMLTRGELYHSIFAVNLTTHSTTLTPHYEGPMDWDVGRRPQTVHLSPRWTATQDSFKVPLLQEPVDGETLRVTNASPRDSPQSPKQGCAVEKDTPKLAA